VFLGRVARVRAEGKVSYVIDPGGRPYAGARAEAIVAPSGEAQVQIGTACGQNAYRFAVFIDNSDQEPAAPSPRLALDEDGAWIIRGDTAVAGNVTIDGGALVFGQGEPYAAPMPWRIYRVADVEERVVDEETVEVAIDELRIEVAERPAGSTDVANQVAIGVWSAQEQKFKPSLTVSDDGTVTIHGDLIVEGNLNPQTRIEAELSAESAALVVGAAMSGAMGFQNVLRNAGPPSGPIEALRSQRGGRTKSSAKSAAPPETENGGGTDPEG